MSEDRGGTATAALDGTARPPYRNLRVWIECFDAALDTFQLARRLEGPEAATLARRLIESSSRLPVSVARGQSSGSAGEFIRCLQRCLSDVSELETHLMLCEELGCVSGDAVRRCAGRLPGIRRMASALIRRLRASSAPPAAPSPREGPVSARSGESGSALLVALLAAAALAGLGLAVLQLADLTSAIAAHARDRDALLHTAETGAWAVKRWFDAPITGDPAEPSSLRRLFLGRFDLRDPALSDRSRRLLDADGDPATPPLPADGSPGRELYRQGREVTPGHPHLDLFRQPFRGGPALAFLGPEEGPDIVLEDRPGGPDVMDKINAILFTDQLRSGRIQSIAVHAPPRDGSLILGIATVTVTAARYPRMATAGGIPVVPPGAVPAARGVVRMGLAAVPALAARGPLSACGSLSSGGALRARWGDVTASEGIDLGADPAAIRARTSAGVPRAGPGGLLGGAALAAWKSHPDSLVEDPWLRVLAGGALAGGEALADQPFPYDPARPPAEDRSNLFQRSPEAACPPYDYRLWKTLVSQSLASDRRAHFLVYDPGTGLFRERGAGPARGVREWTHGREGIFFFDTVDGLPPGPSNLTPPVSIEGGEWSSAGILILHAASFRAGGVAGTVRVLIPPGEPFVDAGGEARFDAGEEFVNLRYPTAAGTGTSADAIFEDEAAAGAARAVSGDGEIHEGSTTAGRDPSGLPLAAAVSFFGLLRNAGDIVAAGEGRHSGAWMAGGDVVGVEGSSSPEIHFDARLRAGAWPPPEIALPRTYVTFWQTSRP
ncbi:MAG TPA: four helix bundle protein [Candidatus Polarisedimenticolia bacterium]|nr:four helix bundle protein [Candidatus Polarisedimenticolia bacterium]